MKSNKPQQIGKAIHHGFFEPHPETTIELEQNKIYTIKTIDNLGYDENLDKHSDYLNPLSGPYSIGKIKDNCNTIAISIKNVKHTRNIGLSSSGLLPAHLSPPLKKPVLGEPITFWKLEDKLCNPIVDGQISPTISLTKSLMIGCLRCVDPIGTKPLSSLDADEHGGNFDCKLFKQGAVIFLPIIANNASFYFGDVHYCQSDGEVGGSGIEVTAEITFSAEPCINPIHTGLHVIIEGFIYFFGVARTIEEGITKAFSQGHEALTSKGISDKLTRLLLANGSQLKIIKLGFPNIVAVGIDSKYFR
ncbi:hypothetical protein DYL59_29670 [Pseudomonas kairouanensis]|uniref:Acetamidase n=1 Tax=Pseudomonas kairouanensis TaxID=2293832 RepID=A0A4Z0AE84_9PSED|nr:acetamidase/formamidase family protein [Pseudomonas kairouanensis]TFY84318.1 hypothetical protein DYL59_29670 [Pseudomonas kairouanensis]